MISKFVALNRSKYSHFGRFWPFFGLFRLITFEKLPLNGWKSPKIQFHIFWVHFWQFRAKKINSNTSNQAPKILIDAKPCVTFGAKNRGSNANYDTILHFLETRRVDLLVMLTQNWKILSFSNFPVFWQLPRFPKKFPIVIFKILKIKKIRIFEFWLYQNDF